jgi:hypothetical protein
MKIKIALLALVLLSCDDDPIQSDIGCRIAKDKSNGQDVFLRCETREEFNPTDIRSSQWDTTDSTYFDYRWEECENCK